MNHLLNELSNAGISIIIRSPKWYGSYTDNWGVELTMKADGVSLEIEAKDDNVEFAVQKAYDKWVSSTGRGLPELTLNQIEHVPPAPDYDDSLNRDPF